MSAGKTSAEIVAGEIWLLRTRERLLARWNELNPACSGCAGTGSVLASRALTPLTSLERLKASSGAEYGST
jgi:hypothetical protein